MSSLYADYIRELTYGDVLETEQGFATYVFTQDDTCYIKEIYIKPEHRKDGAATSLADEIVVAAKAKGCKRLLGSVTPSAKGSTRSLKVLLAYGFKLASSTNDYIIFEKELS